MAENITRTRSKVDSAQIAENSTPHGSQFAMDPDIPISAHGNYCRINAAATRIWYFLRMHPGIYIEIKPGIGNRLYSVRLYNGDDLVYYCVLLSDEVARCPIRLGFLKGRRLMKAP